MKLLYRDSFSVWQASTYFQFDVFCLVFDPWARSSVIWYFLLTYYSALEKKLIINVCRLWTWLPLSESDSYWEHALKW